MDIMRIQKPRCYLLHATAPPSITPAQANEIINGITADPSLPLVVYHDHYIGQPGGVVIFFAETAEERSTLQRDLPQHLSDWNWSLHPLIFSRDPAAFDEQIRFTLATYRNADWQILRNKDRPIYGNPAQEAESATEAE
jgi:hypothetical protein